MDEILLANFMVFHDLASADPYDLWIGDESWELDYYLHENPEQKRAAYVWLTDFVGWLPMPDGGPREAWLTADYNTEMIEHIARYPRVRDRAIFIGAPEDIVPDSSARACPRSGAGPRRTSTFQALHQRLRPHRHRRPQGDPIRTRLPRRRQGCIVTVGGSGVGRTCSAASSSRFPAPGRGSGPSDGCRRRAARRPRAAAGRNRS